MGKRKKRQKIGGQFVSLRHTLLNSFAFKSLDNSAKMALIYFYKDIYSGHQTTVVLTFHQAKNYGVCKSPSTFNSIKKKLVGKGFLDPFEPGGLGKHSIFEISDRWEFYGTDRFEEIAFESGYGSKQFRDIWKDEIRREKLLEARHGKKKQDTVPV